MHLVDYLIEIKNLLIERSNKMVSKISFIIRFLIIFAFAFSIQTLRAENLLEVIDLAFKNSYEYLSKVDTFNADYAYQGLAKSYILPTIDLTADARESRLVQNYDTSTASTPDIDSNTPYLGAAITLTQPLFDKAAWAYYGQSKLLAERAQIQLDNDRNTIILKGVQYYLEVLSARDHLEFATSQKQLLIQQLQETRQQARVGTVKRVDIDQVIAEERNAEYDLINARNNLRVKQDQLNKFINKEVTEYAVVKDGVQNLKLSTPNLQDWLDTASKGNLDILYNQISVKIADKDIAVTKSGYYPSLSLVGSYGLNDTKDAYNNDAKYNEQDGYIGLSLKMNLFQGGNTANLTKQKKFTKSSLEYNLKDLENQVAVTTRQYFLDVDDGSAQVAALERALISSRNYLESARASYAVGLKTTTDVLLAEKDYYDAEQSLSDSKYQYLMSILSLKGSAGILTIKDVEQISEYLVIANSQNNQTINNPATDNQKASTQEINSQQKQ